MSRSHQPSSGGASAQHGRLPVLNWEAMRLHLLWAYAGPPSSTRSSATVPTQTAWLIEQGGVRYRWRDRSLTLSKGQWAILGADRQDHVFEPGSRLISICFRAEWFTGQALFDDTSPIVLSAAAHPQLELAARRLVTAASQTGASATRLLRQPATFRAYLRLRMRYFAWLEALARALHQTGVELRRVGPADERVMRGAQLLDQWPLGEPFDEHAIASAVGLSRAHFNRLFTVELGVSPKAYHERRRFNAAREYLTAGDMPIKTIAYRLAFHDTAHFSNWFRKRAGKSPSQYRSGVPLPWEAA